MPEALGSAPITAQKQMAVHAGNPALGRQRKGSRIQHHPLLLSKFKAKLGYMRLFQKGEKNPPAPPSLSTASSLGSFVKGREEDGGRSHRGLLRPVGQERQALQHVKIFYNETLTRQDMKTSTKAETE